MVDEKGHFLQVATRSTRKARRINRIKPPGAAGRNLQLRFAVRAGTRASIRPKRHPPEQRWPAPSLRRIAAAHWLRPPGTGPELLPTLSRRARTRMGRL